jgi:hypothetical protein
MTIHMVKHPQMDNMMEVAKEKYKHVDGGSNKY